MDLYRAAVINDVIADEHGLNSAAAERIGKELGLDICDVMDFSAAYAVKRVPGRKIPGEDARLAVTMAFASGVISTLRAVKLVQAEVVS
jgi:hypothetical protein